MHGRQYALPASFCSNPKSHGSHELSSDTPTSGEYLPIVHNLQALEVDAASTVENKPLSQFLQSESFVLPSSEEYFPLSHAVQLKAAPTPNFIEYLPILQSLQVVEEDAFVVSLQRPKPQNKHSINLDAYAPTPHSEHDPALALEIRPILHFSHSLASAKENFPAAQDFSKCCKI